MVNRTKPLPHGALSIAGNAGRNRLASLYRKSVRALKEKKGSDIVRVWGHAEGDFSSSGTEGKAP